MRTLFLFFLLITFQSCATKSYTKARLLPQGIKSATVEVYTKAGNEKKLLYTKEMTFTKNGRIRHSKTLDSSGNLLKQTVKKLWFTEELYPGKEPYYCKTRWKFKQRERISCYTKKRYKQNESIYHYNKNGTISKIEDNFSSYHTQHFHYSNDGLSRIVTIGKNGEVIDEIITNCQTRDEKGTCLKELRTSVKTGEMQEILTFPNYN